MMSWLKRTLLRNLGQWNGVIRSGQGGAFHRWAIWLLYRPCAVFNLAFSPSHDRQDAPEMAFFKTRGVSYFGYAWGASGPHDEQEILGLASLVSTMPKPVWVHCEGGRDRTGGLVGLLRAMAGDCLEAICADWCLYGTPNSGWIRFIVEQAVKGKGP
jgi:hypothetical protein